MDDYQKIEILLKEYDTLRTELNERFRQRFQFITIFGSIGAFALFTKENLTHYHFVFLAFIPVVLCIVWFWIGSLIVEESRRIAQIEAEINSLAKTELLCWETTQGKKGLLHRIHRILERVLKRGN